MTSDSDRLWAGAHFGPAIREALGAGLPASELWSLLMGVLEARAGARTPAHLREQWKQDRFVQPCAVDPRALLEVDRHLFVAAADFEAIELSPLAPLGVCSSVALASQNKIVSTARGTEVVSDPTNVLALECARRLQGAAAPVRLATSHRCTRAQAVPKISGFAAHFRMFCLASGGPEHANRAFTSGALAAHINTHLAALERLRGSGYRLEVSGVRLLSIEKNAELAQRVADAVKGAPVAHEALDHAYYDGIRFMIDVRAPDGSELPLIDGGAFDWLRTLTSNNKLAYVASGMGSQLVAALFAPSTHPRG